MRQYISPASALYLLSYHLTDLQELIANHEEHQQLTLWVIARDLEKAIPAMREHILGGQEQLIELLKSNDKAWS